MSLHEFVSTMKDIVILYLFKHSYNFDINCDAKAQG